MLALLALSQAWSRGSAARWRVVAGVGVGAAICLVVLMAYLHAAFGAFRPSYSYYDPNSFSFMQQQGYLGLTYPHPDRLLKILFGCSRGLFFASPVLVAAPCGIVVVVEWQDVSRRGWSAAGIAGYYFLFNASFLLVEGGADVWSAVRGSVHSVRVHRACGGVGTRVGRMATSADGAGCVQLFVWR